MEDGLRHDEHDGLRARVRRLRWRLSGAWMVPTFIATTIAGAVLLSLLPIAGTDTGLVPAFLLCGFANLILLTTIAPALGWWWRRRRPTLPRAIAADRAGSTLMTGLFALFFVLGLTHHSAVVAASQLDSRQLQAVRRYVVHQAPAQYAHHIGSESVWKQTNSFYRTCIPGDDPRKNLCLFVDMSGPNPAITRDPDQQPNSVVAGPDNPGRRGR